MNISIINVIYTLHYIFIAIKVTIIDQTVVLRLEAVSSQVKVAILMKMMLLSVIVFIAKPRVKIITHDRMQSHWHVPTHHQPVQ